MINLKPLELLRGLVNEQLSAAANEKELEELRLRYLGRKGELTAFLKQMGQVPPEERPVIGKLVNKARTEIEEMFAQKARELSSRSLEQRLRAEKIDVTLPGKSVKTGMRHPLSAVLDEVKEIFLGMGFTAVEGPEIEYDYYCFGALNMPKTHPARDTQDTLYITDDIVLRTQTSSVQVRVMEKQKPPIRIISPGRVYRSDQIDATHSPLFHQIEGLVVDKGITMGNLKGILEVFARRLFGEGAKVRFRPHHFPYTEPSAEMDTMCYLCGGKGCRVCKFEGYIELLGCGMVHPKVLSDLGIDPEIYSGFAFGIGLDRIAMRRYGIDDMRLFFENDMRFLSQFR
ncbi:MAG: phenylalanine--tRNA ligase subunit alpha [Oscillospiraceae bacterium]|nr:phenylalanine--tRNA ligase subunit alpha [Oscillospiraceae bacterium]